VMGGASSEISARDEGGPPRGRGVRSDRHRAHLRPPEPPIGGFDEVLAGDRSRGARARRRPVLCARHRCGEKGGSDPAGGGARCPRTPSERSLTPARDAPGRTAERTVGHSAHRRGDRGLPPADRVFELRQRDGLIVDVPSFRPDATREVDLIEEVARHHGYGEIPPTDRRSPFVGRLTERPATTSVDSSSVVGVVRLGGLDELDRRFQRSRPVRTPGFDRWRC